MFVLENMNKICLEMDAQIPEGMNPKLQAMTFD